MKTIEYEGKVCEVLRSYGTNVNGCDATALVVRELNPMPPMNRGDWYRVSGESIREFSGLLAHYPDGELVEIRFADGRPTWRRSWN